ncbi:hypothetical protein Ciccas_008316 [Cichlidogyrus casuarinus]|uniref:Uncharacterized protein n=1 Tax=Cichlidogyrus casuarinus TaxID=1844966 RepID=A0ABD2Q0B3_9PLAT
MLEQSNAEQEHMRLHYEDRLAQLHEANVNDRSKWEELKNNLEKKIKEFEIKSQEYHQQMEKIRSDNDIQLAECQTGAYNQLLNQQNQILDLLKNDKQKVSTVLVGFKNEKGKILELVQQQGILLEGQFKILNQSLSDIQKRIKLVQSPSELVKLISSTVLDGIKAHEVSKNMEIVKNLSNQLENLTVEAGKMRERCREVEGVVRDRDLLIEELKNEHRKELNQLSEKERKLAREFAEEEIAKTRKTMMMERSAQSQTVQELINKMNGKFSKLETEYSRKNNAVETLQETKSQLSDARKAIEEERVRFEVERTDLIKQNEIILSRVQNEYDQHCNVSFAIVLQA